MTRIFMSNTPKKMTKNCGVLLDDMIFVHQRSIKALGDDVGHHTSFFDGTNKNASLILHAYKVDNNVRSIIQMNIKIMISARS